MRSEPLLKFRVWQGEIAAPCFFWPRGRGYIKGDPPEAKMSLKMCYSLEMATRKGIGGNYKRRGPVILVYIVTYYRNLIKAKFKLEADLRVVYIMFIIGT